MALTLAMISGMNTFSANASDFTDAGKIKYNKSVDVISALGIVDGNTDGSFDPASVLTRGAATKIICNMILGSDSADKINVSEQIFTDVSTEHIFASYISYCYSEGIIAGCGDGTFNPEGMVTGDEFLKMLLGALGYDSTVEGFEGDGWETKVEAIADSIGLTNGNPEFIGANNITREEACLYAFNALKADMVEYNEGVKSVTTAENPDTVQFAEKYFPGLTLSGDAVYNWVYTENGVNTEIGTYVDVDAHKIEKTGNVFIYNHTSPVATMNVDGVSVNYYDATVNGVLTVVGVKAGNGFETQAATTGLYLGYTASDDGKYIVDMGEWVNGNELTASEDNTAYYTTEIDGFSGVTGDNGTLTINLDTNKTYTMADGFKSYIMEPNDDKTAVVATETQLSSIVTGTEQTRAVVVTNDNGEAVELYLYGLDNDKILSVLDKSIELAGDDPVFQLAQGLQCKTADVPVVKLAPNYEEHAQPTKLFDNLYFVGGTEAGVFIFEDEDGYIIIDSGYNYMPVGDDQVDGYIIPGMEELGLDPAKIKVILITHTGPDHIGGAQYFEETYGTKVIYGISDAEALQAEIEAGADLGFTVNVEEDTTYTGDNKDAYGKLVTVTCGDNTVMGVPCPRMQPINGSYSGMSYIAGVTYTQEGHEPVEHIWSTYGNTNVNGGVEDMEIYHTSVTNFYVFHRTVNFFMTSWEQQKMVL